MGIKVENQPWRQWELCGHIQLVINSNYIWLHLIWVCLETPMWPAIRIGILLSSLGPVFKDFGVGAIWQSLRSLFSCPKAEERHRRGGAEASNQHTFSHFFPWVGPFKSHGPSPVARMPQNRCTFIYQSKEERGQALKQRRGDVVELRWGGRRATRSRSMSAETKMLNVPIGIWVVVWKPPCWMFLGRNHDWNPSCSGQHLSMEMPAEGPPCPPNVAQVKAVNILLDLMAGDSGTWFLNKHLGFVGMAGFFFSVATCHDEHDYNVYRLHIVIYVAFT